MAVRMYERDIPLEYEGVEVQMFWESNELPITQGVLLRDDWGWWVTTEDADMGIGPGFTVEPV